MNTISIPFNIDSHQHRLLQEVHTQNGLRLSPNRFTSHILQDQHPDRYLAYLIGPFIPNTDYPAADEMRVWIQLTAWSDGQCYVQFVLQDCELDFINRTEDTTQHLNLRPLSYSRRN